MRTGSIERVVCIFPGALGDLLLVLPALRAVRARHGRAHVVLVVPEPLRALGMVLDVADTTASLDAADAAGLFGGDAQPPWLVGRPIVYSWLGAGDEAMRTRMGAAASVARFFTVERGAGPVHAAVAYARALGLREPVRELAAATRVRPPASPAADDLLGRLAGPALAVHVGAGARRKRWDPAGFVQVAHWWRQRGGAVIEIGGPAEAGEPPLLGAPAVRTWPLPDLAALLARVAAYLGNDSGVGHLAGAAGATGVVLLGPGQARRWRPIGGRLTALEARAAGPNGLGLAALSPARVIAAIRRRIALTGRYPDISVRA